MYKAIIFDIGQTLVEYNKPLNWSGLYGEALEYVAEKCNYELSDNQYEQAKNILIKYNTRVNPREHEVDSNVIFKEIVHCFDAPYEDIANVKEFFYLYFRRQAVPFPEVEMTLKKLKDRGFLLGTLSDVAYGMDNRYALEDIAAIIDYISFPFTSNDVGYRKPNTQGLKVLAESMNVNVSEIIYVGDEKKDIDCANNAGAYSVLINRSNENKQYGQQATIESLLQVIDIL